MRILANVMKSRNNLYIANMERLFEKEIRTVLNADRQN